MGGGGWVTEKGSILKREAFVLITVTSSKELILYAFGRNIQRVKKEEYPLHELIRLGPQEIHIALSNPNIDVRILAQGYCVAIVSFSLL